MEFRAEPTGSEDAESVHFPRSPVVLTISRHWEPGDVLKSRGFARVPGSGPLPSPQALLPPCAQSHSGRRADLGLLA